MLEGIERNYPERFFSKTYINGMSHHTYGKQLQGFQNEEPNDHFTKPLDVS